MQAVLDQFHVATADVPIIVCRGKIVLRNPSNRQIADCLGLNEAVDSSQVHDLIVVGAGPAGLAASVYAASEGLDVLVDRCDDGVSDVRLGGVHHQANQRRQRRQNRLMILTPLPAHGRNRA